MAEVFKAAAAAGRRQMGGLSKRLIRNAEVFGGNELDSQISHSTAYHRFFLGYSEHRVPRQNGRGYRIERIYTADYCRYEEPDGEWKRKKIYGFLAILVTAAVLIVGGISTSQLNRIKLIGVMQMLEWLPFSYLAYCMILQIGLPRRMTMGDYLASRVKLKRGALFLAIYLGAVFLLMAAVKISSGAEWESSDAAALLGEALGAVFSFLIFLMEDRRKIKWIKNDTPVPEDANEIW